MLFEPHNKEDAARATKHVLDNRERMSAACFPWGRMFTWTRSVDNLQFFYQEVIPGANVIYSINNIQHCTKTHLSKYAGQSSSCAPPVVARRMPATPQNKSRPMPSKDKSFRRWRRWRWPSLAGWRGVRFPNLERSRQEPSASLFFFLLYLFKRHLCICFC